MQIKKLAVAAGVAGALALSLISASPASADYAPSSGDSVGVGSDTVKYAGDFVADGDHLADAGYNSAGLINKLVNFDATADANARLAYGPDGKATSCAPGTGDKNAGSINATTNGTSQSVCQLNPTIVLRAGLRPVQRPNGSGAGATALAAEVLGGVHNIDYSRASASQASKFAGVCPVASSAGADTCRIGTVTVGTEPLAMLVSAGSVATHAPSNGIATAELTAIYSATTTATNPFDANKTGCPAWQDLAAYRNNNNTPVALGSNPSYTTGGTTGYTSAPSTAAIYPIIPQAGSGTRRYFTGAVASGGINVATVGNCGSTGEENDPEALASSGHEADAIEPMSGGRLNMYQAKDGSGVSTGVAGYFNDPSCAYGSISTSGTGASGNCGTAAGALITTQAITAQGTASATVTLAAANASIAAGQVVTGTGIAANTAVASVTGTTVVLSLKPSAALGAVTLSFSTAAFPTAQTSTVNVALQTGSGFGATNGTPSYAGAYSQTRSLYIYIRKDDLGSATQFQPGVNQNLVRTLLANPCSGTSFAGVVLNGVSGAQGCSTIGGTVYGPGGQPYFAKSGASSLISAAGITPGYAYTNWAV